MRGGDQRYYHDGQSYRFPLGKGLRRHTGENNLQAVQEFQGAREEDKIKYMYSDSAIENNNRDIKSGTAALLPHAGMPLAYWPYAIQCYCFGRNAGVVDGESPYGERFLAYGGNFDQSKMFVWIRSSLHPQQGDR